MLLVTATPHSGNEEGFRSLLGLLKPEFSNLPLDLSGDRNRRHREELARYFVQRRRADIRKYLEFDTAFPDRLEHVLVVVGADPERAGRDAALAQLGGVGAEILLIHDADVRQPIGEQERAVDRVGAVRLRLCHLAAPFEPAAAEVRRTAADDPSDYPLRSARAAAVVGREGEIRLTSSS